LEKKIIFLSTFPPKKCGIASFTNDLIDAINDVTSTNLTIESYALDEEQKAILYKYPVTRIVNSYDLDSFIEAAININNDNEIKLICIEHEFGLYGGELGEYLLGFLSMLEKPFVIRFHTVLPNPSAKMLKVVQAIALLASNVLVMTKHSARVIKQDYNVSIDKIIIIPHGTHARSTTDKLELKVKYDLTNKQILTTFGLLSPNKGIEKGILAMKEISSIIPDAVYIVLGQTHPNLLAHEGEKYREYLQQLIDENSLQENVRLINEYAPTKKLMDYLALTDIYLFTSKDPAQAVSGTFLYAMSAGCPIISNDFVLAKEMLDKETGVILASTDPGELSAHAVRILQNPQLRKEMSNNALLKTINTSWDKVGEKHAGLFSEILGDAFTKQQSIKIKI
jgi:glycosyltransferase involved in cell wall biosynthesis